MRISFACQCGKRLSAREEDAGKRARCSRCGNVVQIPAPHFPEVAAPAGPADRAAEESTAAATIPSVYSAELLAAAPQPGAAAPALASPGGPCPGCGAEMAPGTVLCMACGHDLRTGKRRKTKVVVPKRNPDKEDDEDEKKVESTWWGWIFFVACMAILVATRGGALWGALGGMAGSACLKIAGSREIPLAARLSVCVLITASVWGFIIWLLVTFT